VGRGRVWQIERVVGGVVRGEWGEIVVWGSLGGGVDGGMLEGKGGE